MPQRADDPVRPADQHDGDRPVAEPRGDRAPVVPAAAAAARAEPDRGGHVGQALDALPAAGRGAAQEAGQPPREHHAVGLVGPAPVVAVPERQDAVGAADDERRVRRRAPPPPRGLSARRRRRRGTPRTAQPLSSSSSCASLRLKTPLRRSVTASVVPPVDAHWRASAPPAAPLAPSALPADASGVREET